MSNPNPQSRPNDRAQGTQREQSQPQSQQPSGAANQKQANGDQGDAKSNQGKPASENEGEGSRTAARHYNDETEQYVKSGRVDAAAQEAKRAVDGPEGAELREAEAKGREEGRDQPAEKKRS